MGLRETKVHGKPVKRGNFLVAKDPACSHDNQMTIKKH